MGTSGLGNGSSRCRRISKASLGRASVGCGPNSQSCLLHSQVTSPTHIVTKEEESPGGMRCRGQPRTLLPGNLAGVGSSAPGRGSILCLRDGELGVQEACRQLHRDRELMLLCCLVCPEPFQQRLAHMGSVNTCGVNEPRGQSVAVCLRSQGGGIWLSPQHPGPPGLSRHPALFRNGS